MSQRANYFKLGLFVIGSIVAGILVLVIIGSGRWFERKVVIETYFKESVQGLDIGSKLKYRGVTIGEGANAKAIARGEIAVLSLGGSVRFAADKGNARLILVAGRPLREPVAKYGPFVMNTAEEIHQAIADYQAGRFV